MKNTQVFRLLTIATILLALNFTAKSQVQTARNVSMAANTAGYYEYLPQGYNPNGSETYPLILFIHGTGELGTNLPSMLNSGMAATISRGQFPTSFTINGQTFKFIVISPQFIAWPNIGDVDNVLNYVLSHYKVNPSRVYLTGLSMGGGVVWDYTGANNYAAGRVAAIAPLCGASWPDNSRSRVIATNNIPVWAFHNNDDGTVPSWYTQNYVSQINEAPAPNPQAKKTIFNASGHDCWTNVYKGTVVEDNMNVFQWMLQYQKGTPPPASTNQAPVVNVGPDQNVNGTSITLNATASDPDGSVTSYKWTKVSGPSSFSFSNDASPNTTISNLAGGTYVFRLTATDNRSTTGYDDVSITVYSPVPGRIEAEGYFAMSGVSNETTTDAGGGWGVGYQDNNDWMDYNINVPSTGTYNVSFRVATITVGTQFQVRKADGTVLKTITVPSTGGWQTWTTTTTAINLTAGQQVLRIFTHNSMGGWNFNWMEFSGGTTAPNQVPTVNAGADQTITLPTSSVTLDGNAADTDGTIASYSWTKMSGGTANFSTTTSASTSISGLTAGSYTFRLTATDNSGASASDDVVITVNPAPTTPTTPSSTRIQAESYTSQSGTQLDASTDVGGTQYVGWTEPGDWMDYAVNVATSGTYNVSFRVATAQASQIQLRKADGSVLSTLALPSTGGWQSWQTVTAQVTLAAGQQTLRIYANTSGWNINWWELEATGSTTPATPTTPAVTTRVEAENYSSQSGTQLDAATDAGGTLYVGWTETGDWMDYAVNVATSGTYTVSFRVATIQASQIQLRKADGSVLATVSLPNTGGWQTWQTVTAQVSLTAGSQTLRIHALTNGWNINWWELTPNSGTTPASPYYVKIEAESYGNMSGVQKEGTSDIGGGQDVGYQDDNDWMDYSVNIPASGTYTLNFRVATISVNTQFQLRAADGKVLTTVNVPSTGGWQTWTTTSAVVTLPAGQQTLRIFTSRANGGWNINWWEITSTTQSVTSARSLATEEVAAKSDAGNDGVKVNLYPNPVQDRFSLSLAGNEAGAVLVEIYSVDGKLEKTYRLQKANAGAMQFYLSAQGLTKGQHIVSIRVNKAQVNTTMIKL